MFKFTAGAVFGMLLVLAAITYTDKVIEPRVQACNAYGEVTIVKFQDEAPPPPTYAYWKEYSLVVETETGNKVLLKHILVPASIANDTNIITHKKQYKGVLVPSNWPWGRTVFEPTVNSYVD